VERADLHLANMKLAFYMESTTKAALLISDYKEKRLRDAAIQGRQSYSVAVWTNMPISQARWSSTLQSHLSWLC